MLTYDDALNMNYYKKTSYTGWMGSMRFLIKKEEVKNAETEEVEAVNFHAWVWPGPYIFSATADEKKFDAIFPFDEDGRKAAVDWVNEMHESHKDQWPKKKLDTTIL